MRSLISILLGWFVSFAGTLTTLIAVVLFNADSFQPDVQPSVFWLRIILFITSIYGVMGGFVTALIAQRNEIKHAIGLGVFTLLVGSYFLYSSENVYPNWYGITGLVLIFPEVIFGSWLRIKRKDSR